MHESGPERRIAEPVLRRVAEHRLDLRRDVDPAPGLPRLGHVGDNGQSLDERAVAELGGSQVALTAQLPGHVADERDQPAVNEPVKACADTSTSRSPPSLRTMRAP